MLKQLTTADKILLGIAFLSLIYSETLYFKGDINSAIFVGIWVPSILGFGIYVKLITKKNN